ncbi:MAG: ATP-binding protein [Vicinamibacterales bacterium]
MNEDVKILIVDDEGRNLDSLEVMLQPTGCTPVRATSADEALLAVLRHDFAAMILDIRMPGMSGIELANLVKQRRRTQDVPILFLTAHLADDEDILRGYGVGAVDYLNKPIKPDILRSKINVFIELYRKTRALATLNAELQRQVVAREKAQEELQRSNQALESRVAERTAALEDALLRERRSRDEAERQSRIKDEFLATLSHQLRTPMNAILGWVSLLARGESVADSQHAIEVIQRNARMQAKLIEDLLEMNSLSSGEIRLAVAPIDIGCVLLAAVESLNAEAQAKDVRLAAVVATPLPQVHADAQRVQQILWNVLHNAVKFTGSGGSVDALVTHSDGHVRVLVKDTGCGIASSFLPFVFDRFRQADPAPTGSAAMWGLGLGLSIAKSLVELHGGSIHASSPGENQGATFIVELPVRAQHSRSEEEGMGGRAAAALS